MLAPQPAMVQETLMYQALKNFAYIEGATLLVKGVTGDVEWQDSKTEKWTTKMTFYDSKDKRLGELTLFENEQGIYGVSRPNGRRLSKWVHRPRNIYREE